MTQPPPEIICRPSAWVGKEMEKNPDIWLKNLSSDEIDELEKAADNFLSSSLSIGNLSKENFPLPILEKRLTKLKDTLINGIGFEVIRGLPITKYSQEKAAIIFCGIGVYLGSARSQNAAGHILGHIRNIGADAKDVNTRIYQTADRQTFHTDSADIVGLMCIPPISGDTNKFFKEMHNLKNQHNLSNLSMGMSSDYMEAINHEATFVRIGSKIFGARD